MVMVILAGWLAGWLTFLAPLLTSPLHLLKHTEWKWKWGQIQYLMLCSRADYDMVCYVWE